MTRVTFECVCQDLSSYCEGYCGFEINRDSCLD